MSPRDDTGRDWSKDLKIVAVSIFGIPSPDVPTAVPTNDHLVVSPQLRVGMASGQGGEQGVVNFEDFK